MNFKKMLLVPIFSVVGMSSYAGYMAIYPNLPVTFKELGEWVQSSPVYSDWTNVGNPHDCASAEPLEDTQPLGITYPKVFSGCQQTQERTLTTSEKNTVSGAIRNQKTTPESKVLSGVTYTVNAVGTKVVKECIYNAFSGSFIRWTDIGTSDSYTFTYGMRLQWDGVDFINTVNTTKTYPKAESFIKDGYVYTRGAFHHKSEYSQNRFFYYYYAACREPVTP